MKKIFLMMLGCSIFITGCDREDNPGSQQTTGEAKISTEIDMISDDLAVLIDQQYQAQAEQSGRASSSQILPACATVTVTGTASSWTRTIDFGTTGCEMPNGNILRGIIVITGSTNFDQPSQTLNYSFVDFYHNNRQVEGSRTLTRTLQSTTLQSQLHPVANIELDMTITYPNGNQYLRTGNRVREMVAGYQTPQVAADNEFKITGEWNTEFPNGTVQNVEIITPLDFKMTCPFIVAGVTQYTRNNNVATLNYGDGECDNTALLTLNGTETTITLGN